MANKNKVQFGLSHLYVAPILTSPTGGTPTWDTPIAWPGAVNLSQDAESEEVAFWADNMRYWGTYIDNGYTGEIEVARLIEEIAVHIYGWYVDSRGGLVEVSNGQKKNFALLGQFEGDAHAARWAIYNCAAGKPDFDASTTEDTTEPQTQSAPYTATPINIGNDVMVTKYTLFDDVANPAAHTAYTAWFSKVTLPVPITTETEPVSLPYGAEA